MKRQISSILIFILLSVTAFAQKKIAGKIYDAQTKSPLSGATISFGKNGLVTTDANGNFSIDCNKAGQITVSFIGYQNAIHFVKNCNDEISIGLQAGQQEMDVVEITATSNLNKSILYQPSSISKLTPLELKRGNGLFLDDAINGNVPGVIMQRRAVSSGQQFNIRGYGNGSRGTRGVSSNFDGQGYKVYLNGIPVTDAEGITVLDDIDFGSIGNVEVAKGPSGTLYGLAVAGAVNLRTIKPKAGETSIGQEIMLGNYGLQRYNTRFQMGGERSSLLLNYGHQKSDGFTIHNLSHKDFVNATGDFQPNAKQAVTAYFGYSNSYDERSGELTISQYATKDYTGNIEYIKRNAHSNVYTVRAGLGHSYTFNNHIGNTTTIFGTAFNSNVSSAGGWSDKAATNLGLRSVFDTKFSLNNKISLSGITGVETQRQNATTIGYGMIKNPLDTNAVWVYGNPNYWIIGGVAGSNTSNGTTSDVYTTTATTSEFTEWTMAFDKDFSITAGIGISNMKIRLDDRFYNPATPKKTRQYDTAYKSMVSPHFAINKVFHKKFSAYFSYNKAYKAPVSSYFFIPVVGGTTPANTFNGALNSALKPETGNQFEIGTKGELLKSRLTYQLAFFDAIFSDKMTTVAVPNPANTVTLYSYVVNGGKQDNKGIEAALKYVALQSANGFFKTITPFVNLTYSDFQYKDYKFQTSGKTITTPLKDSAYTTDYSNHPVAGVAKVVANFGVDIDTYPGLYFNMNYFYKDPMPVTSDGLVNNLPYHATSYSLLNTKLGYQGSISKRFDLDVYFGVNNIANTQYPIMVFVNQIPDAYLAAPLKATYFGGVNLKYNIK